MTLHRRNSPELADALTADGYHPPPQIGQIYLPALPPPGPVRRHLSLHRLESTPQGWLCVSTAWTVDLEAGEVEAEETLIRLDDLLKDFRLADGVSASSTLVASEVLDPFTGDGYTGWVER
jgi:hypothetical protein